MVSKPKPRKRHTPLASRYRAGRATEYRVAKALREEGWVVMRTAGSHGDADLICYRESYITPGIGGGPDRVTLCGLPYPVMFVQVKRTPTKADRDKIERLRRETGLDWRLM